MGSESQVSDTERFSWPEAVVMLGVMAFLAFAGWLVYLYCTTSCHR